MLLTETIIRLRQVCPIFERRVQGTQAFVAANAENAQVPVPCCFVVPLYGTAPAMDQTMSQRISENFATIVCLDNSENKVDGKGMSAELALSTARLQLNNALLGWVPAAYPTMDGINYMRDQHLLMNNSRLWHQFQWFGNYYVQADLALNDQWQKIDAIILEHYPDVDAATIRSVLVPGKTTYPAIVGDATKYHEVLSLISGEAPGTWAKRLACTEPSDEPGYISEAQTLVPKPEVTNPPEQMLGDFTRGEG